MKGQIFFYAIVVFTNLVEKTASSRYNAKQHVKVCAACRASQIQQIQIEKQRRR